MTDYDYERSWATEPLFFRAPAPPNMAAKEYQLAGVEYHLDRTNALFGDAPGLGKSAECILLGNAIEAKRSLVVCPASLRLNWEREIWHWSTLPNVSTYPVLKASDGVSNSHNYVIISWALLAKPDIHAAIMAERWDHVILDECLGADTLVLTDAGWKPIVNVVDRDRLWDGAKWVKHEGLLYRGVRPTIQVSGVTITPDHEVLAADTWHPAQALADHENILSRALATASGKLPSSRLNEPRSGASPGQPSRVRAALRLIGWATRALANCSGGELSGAERAPIARKTWRGLRHMLPPALMKLGVVTCADAFKAFCSDAIIKPIRSTATTEGVASACTKSGELKASELVNFSRTLSRCRGGTMRLWKLIASIQMAITNPATSDLLPGKKTWATGEVLEGCNREYASLKPVYDLANAGPLQRFTILSARGPLVVHNCHAIKDPQGNSRTKAICGWMDHGTYRPGVCDVAGRITAASGTITPNQPVEVYNVTRLLDHSALDYASLEDFREFYYEKGGGFVTKKVYDPAAKRWAVKRAWSSEVRNQPRNLEDLQLRLRRKVMVRRLKEDVLKELPPKVWHPFPLALTADIKRALKHPGWDEAARLYDMDPDAFDGGIPIDGEISTARRLLGEAKAPAVADYIEDLLDSGVQKIVVGALHRSVLTILRQRLEKYGLSYMDGGTSSANKQRAADQFQQDERVRIILGQTYVIGEGWTLVAAQDAVLAEPDYVPGRNDQFLDRIHRMGQKGSYLIGHVPVCPGTLDERVISTAVRKDQHIYATMDRRVA